MKFSELINEFSIVWPEWIKYNNIAVNKNFSYSERRKAAVQAEKILNKRYYLIQEINKFFEKEEK
jgi:hypothetical protein